jgi:hypothetical protein
MDIPTISARAANSFMGVMALGSIGFLAEFVAASVMQRFHHHWVIINKSLFESIFGNFEKICTLLQMRVFPGFIFPNESCKK